MQAVCARVILLKKYQLARFWVQSDAVAPGSRLYLAINHSQEATLFAATMSGSHAGPEGAHSGLFLKSYAGTIRMLRSTAWGECVSAPMEM
jgi:hypothetical protein